MSDQIFLCYRRDDTAGYAGRLYDRLAARFGADRVFMDIDGIGLGTDFVEEIEKAVGACKIQIVLIGRRWLTLTDSQGNRRLDDPEDYVRVEIESALKRKIRVIPALVAGAAMPELAGLPESLKPLRRRQGIEISHAGFDGDVSQLIKRLERILGEEGRAPEPEPTPGIVGWWGKLSDQAKGIVSLVSVGVFIGLLFWLATSILGGGTPGTTGTPTADMTKADLATAISILQTQLITTPEATPTPNPLFGTITAVMEEIMRVTPTATLTPTADRTGTVAALLTQVAVSATPEVDRDPTITPTPTAMLEPAMPFEVQAGGPAYISNIAHPQYGCNWLGVAGQVFDQKDSPIVNLGVSLTGTLGGDPVKHLEISGTAPQYGESGFEFKLADTPIASSGTLSIQLLGDDGQPLTDPIFFDTSDNCDENLVLINLVQISLVPLASEQEVSGKGMFIWKLQDVEGGDPDAVAEVAVEADLSFVIIKVADGIQYYRHITDEGRDLLPQTIDALHIKGIQVWGLHYVRGDDPKEEALVGSYRVKDLGLDGYVIDAEAEFKQAGMDEAASIFMSTLRANLPDVPVGLSSYRFPSYHPQFPFEEFLEKTDYMMPQLFWISADNPQEQLEKSIGEFARLAPDLPIIPVGPTFVEINWTPTAEQISEFLYAAQEAGLPAVAFWEWSSAREALPTSIWNTISQFEWNRTYADE